MQSMRRILPLITAAAFAAPLLAHEADNFKLLASDGVDGDAFGSAVALNGDFAVVSAPLADALGIDSGAAYVFRFDGTTWNEVAKLTGSNTTAGDRFGSALSLDGNRLLIGAAGANGGDGSAYAFSFDGVSWNEASILAPAGLAAGAGFGSSLDLDADSAVIGAPNAGAAYVFVDGLLGWGQEASLNAVGSILGDRFGAGVTIAGDLIAVGAPNGTGSTANSGLVNTFSRTAGLWSEGQIVRLAVGSAGDEFGYALDMYAGQELLIGIPGFDLRGIESGGAQRWKMSAGTWILDQGYPGRDADDRMGEAIALHQRTNVIGTRGDDDEALDGGTSSRFLRGSVTPLEIYVGHDNADNDAFGSAVDVSETWAINGAPGHDAGLGSAYIHSAVQAVVEHLDGTFVNPDILETLSGPVIGQPWNLEIDLALYPESERTRIIMKKDPLEIPLMTMYGEVFFSLTAPTLLINDGLGDHTIAVPNNINILDREFTIMGVVYGAAIDGYPILALTNGQTVTVGTTDFPINAEEPHED